MVGVELRSKWSTGMALVMEQVFPKNRGKATTMVRSAWSLGVLLAISFMVFLYPRVSWRGCFIATLLPVLSTVHIIRRIEETQRWQENKGNHKTFIGLFSRKIFF
ncbi:MAG: hypothetical protein DRJ64_08110 [Thermoprotei archaeon]|nr:MAG: hypothetical protein DRJ64_08110 [Thermoprotei archaeon]